MVITEPAVPSTRLLGLGSKLYPSLRSNACSTKISRYCWFARDVTAVVVCWWPEQKHFFPLDTKPYFHVNSRRKILLYWPPTHHQHGRLVTWLQAKNTPESTEWKKCSASSLIRVLELILEMITRLTHSPKGWCKIIRKVPIFIILEDDYIIIIHEVDTGRWLHHYNSRGWHMSFCFID